jgi:hypothetical protein
VIQSHTHKKLTEYRKKSDQQKGKKKKTGRNKEEQASLIIREMQITTTMGYNCTPITMLNRIKMVYFKCG